MASLESASSPRSDFSAGSMQSPLDKEQLVTQILDLQEALQASLQRVESARGDHTRISVENQTLLQYINNLMSATGPPMPPRRK
ncbi:hypothetical protein PhCBS80983_g04688 [Powellomyces hirtus]|uniref:Short coiled-coil protein n=1 Tax=Powellomyces hirtus TaxID=109895 RepID=A0A507DWV6_9FUNG|nr:hypothetical protein DFJ77DRAFT_448968 [Powellomyces hirtus]TPX56204.1 hypothetical protein PhCBS80983_g04688 [Powellomyces hirtus]